MGFEVLYCIYYFFNLLHTIVIMVASLINDDDDDDDDDEHVECGNWIVSVHLCKIAVERKWIN